MFDCCKPRISRKHVQNLTIVMAFFITFVVFMRADSNKPNAADAAETKSTNDATFNLKNIEIKKWSSHVINNRRIFLHETSGRNYLTFRQCCAVESVAKNNPTRPVQVHLSADRADVDKFKGCLAALDNYTNVEILLVDTGEFFKDSPLEQWYNRGEWRTSKFKHSHLSEFTRALGLLRGGGLYLDMDFIVLRELPEQKFTNVLVVEGDDGFLLSSAVLHLNAGHRLAHALVDFISENYDPEDYILHGPTAITQSYTQLCSKSKAGKKGCPDVKLIPYKSFNPLGVPFWAHAFKNASDITLSMIKDSYGVHLWGSLSDKLEIFLGTNQLYALLAQTNCPHCVKSKIENTVR